MNVKNEKNKKKIEVHAGIIALSVLLAGAALSFSGCGMQKGSPADAEEADPELSQLSIDNAVKLVNDSFQYEIDAPSGVPKETSSEVEVQEIYETDVNVTYIDVLEIYKQELEKNSNANNLSAEEILKIIEKKSDKQKKTETIRAEVLLSEGEWVLADESVLDSVRNEQVAELLSCIINGMGTMEIDDLFEYEENLRNERNG